MRRLLLLLVCGLLLAACASPTPPPPPTLPPPTDTPPLPTVEPLVVSDLVRTVTVPIPGTLAIAPNVLRGTITPFTFDEIVFTRSGGLQGVPLTITLRADGTGTRNDTPFTTTPEQVEAIRGQLAAIDFYNISGQFTGLGVPADAYLYTINVSGEIGSSQINAQDGLTPAPLLAIFTALLRLGE